MLSSVFGQNFYWHGRMDEVLVFDHALAPEEIQDLATPVVPFTGFFPPLSNPPVLNVVQAGQAIPVKFSLGENRGLAIFAPGSPQSQGVPCDSDGPSNDVQPTDTAGGSGLTYDPTTDEYTYVWKTDRKWRNTCRTIEFIPLSFWYDAPLTSQDRDRRHDLWLVYGSPTYSPARWSSWISPA